MAEYIDKSTLLRSFAPIYEHDRYTGLTFETAKQIIADHINSFPTIDIVRCRDCKYSSYEPHEEYKNVYICNRTVWTRMNGGNTADDYCSYGRIKEE